MEKITDGCACQYKGKNAFFDVSQRTQPQILRNFFETSHGKSVCDGLGAVVKGSCYQAVVSGKKIICNAEDMMDFCQEKLQVPQKTVSTADGSKFQTIREFLYVERKQVDRKRPEVKTLPGTRKLHCVRGKGKEFHLDVRALSCYCQGCRQDTRCQNEEFTASWEPRQIQIQRTSTPSTNTAAPTTTTSTTATSHPTSVMASTTIMNGDFVAVKLTGNKSNSVHIYMALVLDISENKEEVHLSFMKKCGNDLYIWPTPKDESWEPAENIVCVVNFPQLVNKREQFRFPADDIAKVKTFV